MTEKHQRDDDALDAMFGAARSNSPDLGTDFMARLMVDAEVAVAPPRQVLSSEQVKGPSFWSRLAATWLPASGLTAATVMGVWIGLALPESQLADSFLTGTTTEIDLSSFLPGADLSQFTALEVDG
ncbi:MAG: hypothetical protein GKR98_00895 [Boseongicola sp.]|nr:MAG: hypothetical protein GKR98_00895 [Boseongicola sp.]